MNIRLNMDYRRGYMHAHVVYMVYNLGNSVYSWVGDTEEST